MDENRRFDIILTVAISEANDFVASLFVRFKEVFDVNTTFTSKEQLQQQRTTLRRSANRRRMATSSIEKERFVGVKSKDHGSPDSTTILLRSNQVNIDFP